MFRNSRSDVFCTKVFFKNFPISTGKHFCQSIFFNKVAELRHATLLKKRLWHRCIRVIFAKFLNTSFLIEHLWWLLLHVVSLFMLDEIHHSMLILNVEFLRRFFLNCIIKSNLFCKK